MKKIIGLILIILLAGCSFVMPDDTEFMQVVKNLDTPEKIGNYMSENFEYDSDYLMNISKNSHRYEMAYNLWETKKGICIEFANFGMFVANYHGYETYIAIIYFYESITDFSHAIAIYKENGEYNYSDNRIYFLSKADKFKDIIDNYPGVEIYRIYDYDGNLTEEKVN